MKFEQQWWIANSLGTRVDTWQIFKFNFLKNGRSYGKDFILHLSFIFVRVITFCWLISLVQSEINKIQVYC